MEIKKLYRSNSHRVVAGVCGGIGEYFAVDPILIRLTSIFLTIVTGLIPGIIMYIIAVFGIPRAS